MHVVSENSEVGDIGDDHDDDDYIPQSHSPQQELEEAEPLEDELEDTPHPSPSNKKPRTETLQDDDDDHLHKKSNVEPVSFCDILLSLVSNLDALEKTITNSLVASFKTLDTAVKACN